MEEIGDKTSDHKETLRVLRNTALEKRYKRHSIILAVISTLAVIIGAVTIYIGTKVSNGAFYAGGPLISACLSIPGCVTTLFLYKQGKREEDEIDTTGKLKCLFIMHYVFHLLLVIFGFVNLLPIIFGLSFCYGLPGTSCDGYEGAIIALSVLGILLCLAISVWSIVAVSYFCILFQAFGLRSSEERLFDAMVRMNRGQGLLPNNAVRDLGQQVKQPQDPGQPVEKAPDNTQGVSRKCQTQQNTTSHTLAPSG